MKLNKFISPVIFMGLLFNVLYPSNVYTIFKENKSCITSSINSEYWFYNKVNYLGIDLKYYSKKNLEFGLWINEYDGLDGKNGVSISGIKMGNFDVEGAGGYGRFGLNYEYMGYYSKYVQRLWFNIAYIDYSSFDNTDLVDQLEQRIRNKARMLDESNQIAVKKIDD